MKIKEIEVDRCGKCQMIDYCGDPYEEPHLCTDNRLADMEAKEYIRMAQESLCGSNEQIAEDVLKRATILKPCPFCGGEALLRVIEPHSHKYAKFMPDYQGGTFIECASCTCGVSGETTEEAVTQWNRRA
ncbi:MAG: hypothetical protein HFE75_11510 [Firmicutes bacterium]|jgi:Lar family restriction alleviation protein|nr:hypothetical protein [Bacillota bacterium]